MKWLILFIMPALLHAKVVYESLDPTSIREHLAYYELYNSQEALETAWKLLSKKSQKAIALSFPSSIDDFIALINPSDSTKNYSISEEALLCLEEVAGELPNRKLKGHTLFSEDELKTVASEEIDLARALLITQLDDRTKIRQYEAALDLMALQVLARCKEGATTKEKVQALNQLIFYELGFRFPPHSTYSKQIDHFTFLPHVLESRRGVCLGVSALYICLLERIGVDFEVITPPGHIFMRCDDINIETTLRGVHIHDDEYLGINLTKLPRRTKKEVIGMAFFNQASIFLSQGSFDKAASCYKRALPYMPNDKMLHTLLAYSLFLTDNENQARTHLKIALDIHESHLLTQNSLAEEIYYNRVDKESLKPLFLYVDETHESIQKKASALQESIKKCPNFRSAIFSLAICYLQLNKPQEAIFALEEYHRQAPDDITALFYLAELYYARFDAPSAWKYYDKAEKLAEQKGMVPELLKQFKTILSIRSPR